MKNLLYISILVFLFSCTKGGGNVYIEGRVYNPITGEGIEGANIILFRDKPFSGALGAQSGGSKTVESVVSDSDGYYKIKHAGIASYIAKMYKLGNYEAIGWVNIHSKNKIYSAKGGGNFEVKLSKNMHADFQAVSYGYLKLSIHNVNCQGAADLIILERNNLTIPSYDGYSPMNFPGCYDYDASDCAKVPSGEWQYKWTVIRNGTTSYHDTTFLLNEGECAWIKVNY